MSFNHSFNIQHPVKLFPQPTNMTCWSAATTMLFGSKFSAGPATAQTKEDGGIYAREANIGTFARDWGLKVYWPQSWTVQGLVDVLRRGPVALVGAIPMGHVVVLAGIRGDGTQGGTQITLYNPAPTNIGKIETVNYSAFMTHFPLGTMYLLQR
jgi:hypothetical protein